MPTSDNVREYMNKTNVKDVINNCYVPLKIPLFGYNLCYDNTSEVKPTTSKIKTPYGNLDFTRYDNEPIPRARATASASYSGYDKSNITPREVIFDPAAAKTPEEAYQMLVDKILNFNEDSCTAEGFISYLIKGKIPYKKTWRKRELLNK